MQAVPLPRDLEEQAVAKPQAATNRRRGTDFDNPMLVATHVLEQVVDDSVLAVFRVERIVQDLEAMRPMFIPTSSLTFG